MATILKNIGIAILCVAVVVVVTLPLTTSYLDPSNLILKSIDEDAFQGVLYRMHDGINSHDLTEMAVGAFLGYGWFYFFSLAVITFPFSSFVWDNAAVVIFIPRLYSVITAGLSLFLIYKIARLQVQPLPAGIIAALLLTLPAFYTNAGWMHPDHPVVAGMLATFYFLCRDKLAFKRNFYLALVFLGISLATKLTALVFLIVPLVHVGYGWISKHRSLPQTLWAGLKTLIIPVVTFVIVTPTALMRGRVGEIIAALQTASADNKIAHGYDASAVTIAALLDKVITTYYMPLGILLLTCGLFIYGGWKEWQQRSLQPIVLLSGSWFILFLLYNLTQVNKLWHHYYLPVFLFAPLAYLAIRQIKIIANKYNLALGILLLIQLTTLAPAIAIELTTTQAPDSRDYGAEVDPLHNQTVVDHAVAVLAKHGIQPHTVLVSPRLPFPREPYGLTADTLHRIYGMLSEAHISGAGYPDVIVLDKGDYYFISPDDPQIVAMTSYVEILAGQAYVAKLKTGYTLSLDPLVHYEIIADDNLILLLQRQP